MNSYEQKFKSECAVEVKVMGTERTVGNPVSRIEHRI